MIKISQTCEFDLVFTVELILAVLSDGRWYTSPAVMRRLKIYKGVASGTLNRLWREGYVERAPSPLWNQSTRASNARFVYRTTGKAWAFNMWECMRFKPGNRDKMKWAFRFRSSPRPLRQLFY